MEIVIKIPEERYNQIKENKYDLFGGYIFTTIRNGIPLPKGHGRLIDISEYENNYSNIAITFDDANHIYKTYASSIPTIIPADTESGGEE